MNKDILAAILITLGLIAGATGVTAKYGWEMALIVVGVVLSALGVLVGSANNEGE